MSSQCRTLSTYLTLGTMRSLVYVVAFTTIFIAKDMTMGQLTTSSKASSTTVKVSNGNILNATTTKGSLTADSTAKGSTAATSTVKGQSSSILTTGKGFSTPIKSATTGKVTIFNTTTDKKATSASKSSISTPFKATSKETSAGKVTSTPKTTGKEGTTRTSSKPGATTSNKRVKESAVRSSSGNSSASSSGSSSTSAPPQNYARNSTNNSTTINLRITTSNSISQTSTPGTFSSNLGFNFTTRNLQISTNDVRFTGNLTLTTAGSLGLKTTVSNSSLLLPKINSTTSSVNLPSTSMMANVTNRPVNASTARFTSPTPMRNVTTSTMKQINQNPAVKSTDLQPNCPRTPSISSYIDSIDEKCTDVTDRARDFYVDHVDYSTSIDEFEQELKNRIEPDFQECRIVIANSRESLRKALNLTSNDFNAASWNGGFMTPPRSCYNRVVLALRLGEEKMKAFVDVAVEQLNFLFSTYFEKKVKSEKKH